MDTQNATKGLFRTKSIEDTLQDTTSGEHSLKRELSALDLTVYGIGVIVGTGIFVLTGNRRQTVRGPSGRAIIRRGRCRLRPGRPVLRRVRLHGAGGGLRVHLLLRLARGVAGLDHRLGPDPGTGARRGVVAVGWSGYIRTLLSDIGIDVPTSIGGDRRALGLRHPGRGAGPGADRAAGDRDQGVGPVHHGDRGGQGGRGPAGHRGRRVLHQGFELHALHPADQQGGDRLRRVRNR